MPKTGTHDLCSFELLRKQYHQLGEDSKFESFLAHFENKIHAVEDPILRYLITSRTRDKLFTLQSGFAAPYAKLGAPQLAENWFIRMQVEIENAYGADGRNALLSIMQTGLFHLGQNMWKEAEPWFQEAQSRAESLLDQDDPMKQKVARCLVEQRYEPGCWNCKL
jgi:hypothetical protein